MKRRSQFEMFVPAEEARQRVDNARMWGYMIGAAGVLLSFAVLYVVSGLLTG